MGTGSSVTRNVKVWRGDGNRLRLFVGDGNGRGAERPRAVVDDGRPTLIGRINGYPLAVRVWPHRPGRADAIYHPSGVWIWVEAP